MCGVLIAHEVNRYVIDDDVSTPIFAFSHFERLVTLIIEIERSMA
jgi:hypothetical protein